jgi:glycosyltransferase involved in cell wall biosynthesis
MRADDPRFREALTAFASDRYDLVWISGVRPYVWTGRPERGPTIVDLIDLEDDKERQRAALLLADHTEGLRGRLRTRGAAFQARHNGRAWTSLQHQVAGAVDSVCVCSVEDRQQLGQENAHVVVNSYPRPARPLGRPIAATPPVLLFPGTYDYGPNADGAEWLARNVAPLIRSRLPGVQIRLVGRSSPRVRALADTPGIEVVGEVPEMDPELANADVVVVPLRVGSGTRLKILESFAHRIPVVSTTVGASGLGVTDGVHLLIGDDPTTFADACVRAVQNADLRAALVDRAEVRYLEAFETTVAEHQVASLAQRLISQSHPDRATS